jgi:hypothetical protein
MAGKGSHGAEGGGVDSFRERPHRNPCSSLIIVGHSFFSFFDTRVSVEQVTRS